ncbi:MAG: OFA family MFS transporter [Halorubrum sp.]
MGEESDDGGSPGGRDGESTGGADDGAGGGIDYAARAADILGFSRWWQIAAAAGMMAAVSPYQYVWSSISPELSEGLDIALPALGAVFSFYVVFQSLSQFPAGKWRDSRGPGALTFLAAVLAGGGYIGLAYATSLWQLYVLYSLGAVGVGIVYTVAVNTAVKWFPDRTGLTTGVGTMAFAAGSALVVPYVQANATVSAYSDVLRNIGIGILVVTLVGSFLLRDPPTDWLDRQNGDDAGGEDGASDARLAASIRGRNYSTREMLSTWQFWLLYAMFIAMAGADLLVIANVVQFAENFGLAELIATLSATLLPVAAGVSRLILGEAIDRFDRKRVMAGSFLLAGLFRIGLVRAGEAGSGAVFVAFVLGAMFFSSPLYVFFPSLLADYYGAANSSGNYAALYTAKVGGGVFSGVAAGYLVATMGWNPTFILGGALAVAAGVAVFVLRPPSGSGLESTEPATAD